MTVHEGTLPEAQQELRRAKWAAAGVAVPALVGGVALEYLAFKSFQNQEIGLSAVSALAGLGVAFPLTVLGLEWMDKAEDNLHALEAQLDRSEYVPRKLVGE